ncbi:acyltransferase family protein [Smaragdicoccus niigatensis]|uniref:acyltransferase family protein n=1 Tax=Smaragdicoccus niigatensis TaxID=359359 RepID=UPI00036CB9DC|nr:acyltransferase family protein [Smaragdicoccus niigatensis]
MRSELSVSAAEVSPQHNDHLASAITAPKAPKQRVAWVDIAKGMTIVLVVLLHSTDMLVRHDLVAPFWESINGSLQPIRMPLFFVASGLFAQKTIAMTWPTMLRSRTAHLFYLYLLWTVLFFVVHNILPAETRHDGYAQFQSIITGIYVPNSALWFIYGLAVFGVVAKLLRNQTLEVQFGLAIALNITAQYVTIVNFGWNNLAEYFVYFLVGLNFREIVVRISNYDSNRWIAASVAVYVATSVIYGLGHAHGLNGLKILVSTSGLVLGVLVASRMAGTWIGDVFNYIGKNTIGVYLMFDIMIAIVVYGLIQVPDLATIPGIVFVTPLAVAPVVVLMALGTKMALVAAGQHWLFELPAKLRGTAK